ncbi:hypothetical protein ACJMK2_011327, partial [Sinanodonta woodiana]
MRRRYISPEYSLPNGKEWRRGLYNIFTGTDQIKSDDKTYQQYEKAIDNAKSLPEQSDPEFHRLPEPSNLLDVTVAT